MGKLRGPSWRDLTGDTLKVWRSAIFLIPAFRELRDSGMSEEQILTCVDDLRNAGLIEIHDDGTKIYVKLVAPPGVLGGRPPPFAN